VGYADDVGLMVGAFVEVGENVGWKVTLGGAV
jgi:hypothetical protein